MKPRVAPEKRPSVSRATESPSPSPMIAAVTASISRMPGPPAGPSLRMTTTSPGSIFPCVTAAIASSSSSNTRAGPAWWTRSWPESFTTQPSGARLPRRMAMPPVGLSGLASGLTTSWPGVSCAVAGQLADRLAVDGRRVLVQQAGLQQAGGDDGGAAGGVHVGGHEAPAGLEVAQQRRLRRRCGRSRRSRARGPPRGRRPAGAGRRWWSRRSWRSRRSRSRARRG